MRAQTFRSRTILRWSRRPVSLVGLTLLWITAGCASASNADDDGSGGSGTASGGSHASGGTTFGSGGHQASGGASSGGVVSSGGASSGGASSGGTSSGGTPASGGSPGSGGSESSGGASSGGAASGGAASGGASSGGASSGGASSGGAGSGGAASGGASSGGASGTGGGCSEDPFPTTTLAARSDTAAAWDDNDFDDAELEPVCGALEVTATWPHELGYASADPGEANQEPTRFTVLHPYTLDLTGKQLNVTATLLEDGLGSATEGGYTVYLGATDGSDYTEVSTVWAADYVGQLYAAGDSADISFVIPSNVAAFDATEVIHLVVRIESKHWAGPVFDYEVSVIELSDLTVTDAP